MDDTPKNRFEDSSPFGANWQTDVESLVKFSPEENIAFDEKERQKLQSMFNSRFEDVKSVLEEIPEVMSPLPLSKFGDPLTKEIVKKGAAINRSLGKLVASKDAPSPVEVLEKSKATFLKNSVRGESLYKSPARNALNRGDPPPKSPVQPRARDVDTQKKDMPHLSSIGKFAKKVQTRVTSMPSHPSTNTLESPGMPPKSSISKSPSRFVKTVTPLGKGLRSSMGIHDSGPKGIQKNSLKHNLDFEFMYILEEYEAHQRKVRGKNTESFFGKFSSFEIDKIHQKFKIQQKMILNLLGRIHAFLKDCLMMKKGKANQYMEDDCQTEWGNLVSTFLLDNKQFLLADGTGNTLLSNITKGIAKSQRKLGVQEPFDGTGLIARKLMKCHNEEKMKASMKTFFKPFEKILTPFGAVSEVATLNRKYKVNQKIAGITDRSSSQESDIEP